MNKIILPLFISCTLWGVNNGDTWVSFIPTSDSRITLNSGDNFTIYLDRDPKDNVNRGNNFGNGGSTNLNLTSNNGASSLTLKQKDTLANLQFYHNPNNTIFVGQDAQLKIQMGGFRTVDNRFFLNGGLIKIGNRGSFSLSGVYRLSIGSDGGSFQVEQGGNAEITNVREIKIVTKGRQKSGIINNGGTLTLKTEVGVFNSTFTTDGSLGSSFDSGEIIHNGGTTTIKHIDDNQESLLYNAGYESFGATILKHRHALLEVNGGTFNVVGNLYNGGRSGGGGGAGLGWIVGRGGTINVSNTLYNYSLDSSLPSKIDLENSTIQAKTLLNRENGEIYLKDKAHIEATTFTSDTNSKVVFIGNGDGFGSITAQNLTLNGDKIYQVQLLKNALKLKYLIATSTNLQGLSDGDINLIDNNGIISDRYQAQIVTEGNDTYIQLTPKDGYVPPTLPTPPTPPTTTPSTPPTTSPSPQSPTTTPNYISNTHSIQTELTKQYLILTTSTLEQTTQTILSQIEQIQALKSISTYALSNLYNRSIQAQIKQPKPLLAYNQPTLYPMPYTQGDYLPPPLIEREKKLSVFANLIGGVFGYDSHLGGNYGINAGADYLLGDSLFLGGYGVLLGKTLQQEGLQMQGFQFELGGYGRYLLSDWEFDTTLSYALLALSTQRAFTLYSQTFSQNASFNTHFFNLEERVGYRFALSDFDTLKPFGGVALHIYSQPSYEESGDFSYTQNAMFYGALGLLAGLEYRKVFQSSSIYLGASFLYQLPIFGDMTYSLQYLDSLLYFKNSQDFIAQVQGGVDFTLTPRSFLSLDLNYRHSLSNYFDVDFMLGYRHLF